MRRASPRQLGSICQRCTATPLSAAVPLGLRATHATARRRTLIRPTGARWLATQSEAAASSAAVPAAATETSKAPAKRTRESPEQMMAKAEESLRKFSSVIGAGPNKQAAVDALQACLQAATALHPQLRRAQGQARASASRLALLGGERTGASFDLDAGIKVASGKISQAAYTIVAHPNVEMTPDVLNLYVHTQAELGRPESLPSVLELYAHKAKPVVKNGAVQYIPQNPNAAVKAIEKPVADLALQTAIDARNLDAALGVTEAAFCVKAFKRQKLIKRASAPGMALVSLPFGILGLGTAYANYWQNTMDVATATGIGAAGIAGYFFVTGSLGVIALLSHKAQMKRVTWLPGTPLRHRWMREEEREALDKISCAWGFKESWRHGEETGPEWEGLREHMGYRQMILDRVEFMEGMS